MANQIEEYETLLECCIDQIIYLEDKLNSIEKILLPDTQKGAFERETDSLVKEVEETMMSYQKDE